MKNELKEQLDPYFNNIKDLIKSTATGTETVLGKEIEYTRQAVNSVKKDVEDLRSEMHEMKEELKADIENVRTELSDKIDTRIDGHEAKSANIAHKAA